MKNRDEAISEAKRQVRETGESRYVHEHINALSWDTIYSVDPQKALMSRNIAEYHPEDAGTLWQ